MTPAWEQHLVRTITELRGENARLRDRLGKQRRRAEHWRTRATQERQSVKVKTMDLRSQIRALQKQLTYYRCKP